ncbi:MAG: hypothetical protein VX246_09030 [Myxococcota bacterium]|nr:hypothetical protein [Myxococcota bacterium]
MESFVRMLVVAALTLVMASACGGREEQSAAGNAVAKPSDRATAPEVTGDDGIVDSSGKLSLTPQQAEDLLRVRAAYAQKNAGKPKKPSFERIESEDGGGIELPSDFPVDIPIYPGSVPMQHVSSATSGTMTVFETDESPDSTRRHLSNALTNEGWSIVADMSDEGLTMMTAKKDGREISVSILIDGGTTKITTFQN